MVSGPEIGGILAVLATIPALYLVWVLWDIRYNISVMWFTIAVVVFSLWVFTSGVALLVSSTSVVAGLLYFARIVGIVTTLSVFFFVLEYTVGRTLSVRTTVPFLLVPVTTVGALLVRPESFMTVQFGDGPYTLVFGQFGLVHLGYSVLLHVMSLTLLFRGYLVTSGKQRKQVTLIFAWYSVAVLSVFLPVISPVPTYANPGIFGLLALLVATTYSLQKYDLFTIGPLDNRYVFDEIDDAVVMLNTEGSVMDFNQSAEEQFGFTASDIGHSVTTVFATYPALQELHESEETERTLTQQTASGEKHFAATTSTFNYGRGSSGEILVLRDITPVKDREEDLDMLRRVFTRVFRHNIRNDLNVIGGHLQKLQSELDDEHATQTRPATNAVERIFDHSEKALQAGHIVGETHEIQSWSLLELVSDTVSNCGERYPDATIVNNIDDVSVRAIKGFEKALEGGIENAAEHNPDPVVIELSSEGDDDTVTVVIEDNGTGIPTAEIDALTAEQETAMAHTSGVGLWLMKWLVEKSNGEFDIEQTETGTRIEMCLDRG